MRLNITILLLLVASPLIAAERRDVGLTQKGTLIRATVIDSASSRVVILIGGMGGRDESSRVVEQEAETFEAIPQNRRPFRLIVIAVANPDATRLQFPPTGVAYRENADSHALWRWIGIHAPDLVLVAGNEDYGLADALSRNAAGRVAPIPARRVAP